MSESAGGLAAGGLGQMRVAELLLATSGKTPTPGGGAIAALTGALGCSLAGMVVSYSVGKKDLAGFAERLASSQVQLGAWGAELVGLGDADAEAYAKLNALQKLAPDDARRAREMAGAVEGAVGVPMRCLRVCERLALLCQELAPITNKYLRSDLAIAAGLARAGAEASAINVRINLPLVEDVEKRLTLEREVGASLGRAGEVAQRVMEACK